MRVLKVFKAAVFLNLFIRDKNTNTFNILLRIVRPPDGTHKLTASMVLTVVKEALKWIMFLICIFAKLFHHHWPLLSFLIIPNIITLSLTGHSKPWSKIVCSAKYFTNLVYFPCPSSAGIFSSYFPN